MLIMIFLNVNCTQFSTIIQHITSEWLSFIEFLYAGVLHVWISAVYSPNIVSLYWICLQKTSMYVVLSEQISACISLLIIGGAGRGDQKNPTIFPSQPDFKWVPWVSTRLSPFKRWTFSTVFTMWAVYSGTIGPIKFHLHFIQKNTIQAPNCSFSGVWKTFSQ